jgi:lipoprotein NlpI
MSKLPIVLLVLVFSASAMSAQSRDDNRARCSDDDADITIGGCTALIQSGQETTENLPFVFFNRGHAYDDKGQYDRAIADYDQAIRLKPDADEAFNNRGFTYQKKAKLTGPLVIMTKPYG